MCNILTLHQVIICISKIIFMWCCLRMLSMSYTTRFANVLKFLLLCASWLVVFFPYYERKKKKIERQRERKLLSSLLLLLLLFTHPFLSVYSLPILFPSDILCMLFSATDSFSLLVCLTQETRTLVCQSRRSHGSKQDIITNTKMIVQPDRGLIIGGQLPMCVVGECQY